MNLSFIKSYRDDFSTPKHYIIKKISYLDEFTSLYDDSGAHFSNKA